MPLSDRQWFCTKVWCFFPAHLLDCFQMNEIFMDMQVLCTFRKCGQLLHIWHKNQSTFEFTFQFCQQAIVLCSCRNEDKSLPAKKQASGTKSRCSTRAKKWAINGCHSWAQSKWLLAHQIAVKKKCQQSKVTRRCTSAKFRFLLEDDPQAIHSPQVQLTRVVSGLRVYLQSSRNQVEDSTMKKSNAWLKRKRPTLSCPLMALVFQRWHQNRLSSLWWFNKWVFKSGVLPSPSKWKPRVTTHISSAYDKCASFGDRRQVEVQSWCQRWPPVLPASAQSLGLSYFGKLTAVGIGIMSEQPRLEIIYSLWTTSAKRQ